MIYMDKITVVIIEPFICEELNFRYLRYIANVCILLNVIVKPQWDFSKDSFIQNIKLMQTF